MPALAAELQSTLCNLDVAHLFNSTPCELSMLNPSTSTVENTIHVDAYVPSLYARGTLWRPSHFLLMRLVRIWSKD